ncbi:MAG: hypothetical protein FWG67_06655 [Defluviitaleaceae bacterium]|nr:hypothetical protein [Defluviitaleaceae bacterium]
MNKLKKSAITSFASKSTQQQLKDLVDAIHIKNSYFNADEIFIELRYAIQSIESNRIVSSSQLNQKERQIEEVVSKILSQLYHNPKKERHRKCVKRII